MLKASPTKIDDLLARAARRKCDDIIDKTYAAFYAAAKEHVTLSLDELLAVGTTLFMRITVQPAEKMSTNPKEMRRQLGWALVRLIKQPGDDDVH